VVICTLLVVICTLLVVICTLLAVAAAPRFRNSITVSSGELSRSNKRPHSIISVSSSSSSGGSSSSTTSQSSASGYGPLIHLGFDPVDSPHMHHRSTTLNSQCSMGKIALQWFDTDSIFCCKLFSGGLLCILCVGFEYKVLYSAVM
jgi:hypothetical protein